MYKFVRKEKIDLLKNSKNFEKKKIRINNNKINKN